MSTQKEQDRYYEEDHESAFQASLSSYDSLDRWLLALSSGGVAVCVSILTGDNHSRSFIGLISLLMFLLAVVCSISAKFAHYRQCERKRDDVEVTYRDHPDSYRSMLFNACESKWQRDRDQQDEFLKAVISFFMFGVFTLAYTVILEVVKNGT